jgi:HD-like signal output (HDOD) protein
MTAGMLLGSISDLLNIGVGTDFLDKVSRELAPGKAAVIAEVDEDWVTPLNTRMEAIGGTVLREWRSDFEEAEIAKETAARKAELAQLKAEMAQSTAKAKTKLQKRVNEVKAKLDELSNQAQTKLQKLEKDTNAKISALNDQIAKANAENKARIKERLVELRADHDRRVALLKQAGALIGKALAA